jgi:hypothetical protein
MARVCSQCHTRFEDDPAKPHPACPACRAEAGLERVKAVPLPMKVFACVLVLAFGSAATAVAWSLGG